jgi:hypothetical protein
MKLAEIYKQTGDTAEMSCLKGSRYISAHPPMTVQTADGKQFYALLDGGPGKNENKAVCIELWMQASRLWDPG